MKNLSTSQKWEIVLLSIKEINEYYECLNYTFMKVSNKEFNSFITDAMKEEFSFEEIVLLFKNAFLTIQSDIMENRNDEEYEEKFAQNFPLYIDNEIDYYVNNKEDNEDFEEEIEKIKEILSNKGYLENLSHKIIENYFM